MSGDADAAQARLLVSALQDEIGLMAGRLAKLERQIGSERKKRNSAIRVAMAELRRDIGQARFLIERLHRRFPEVAPSAELMGRRSGVVDRELFQRAVGFALHK